MFIGQLAIQIFQMTFSSWLFFIMSDFWTQSMLSFIPYQNLIHWFQSLQMLLGVIKSQSFCPWFRREIDTVLLDSLLWITTISTQYCSHYSGNTTPTCTKFQRWTANAGTGGFVALSSASLKENLSQSLDN